MSLFDRFLSTPEASAAFGEATLLQHMLDFEAALSRAEAEVGLIPAGAAEVIAAACDVQAFDTAAIVTEGRRAGSVAIPLVRHLTAAVAARDAAAAGYVHWGSTSQDVIDTGMVLATRGALGLIERDRKILFERLLGLAETHLGTPMIGRTLMQPAQVVSFGLKLAGWAAPLARAGTRIAAASGRALQLQLGGAVGTLSVLGEHGPSVAASVARQLQLVLPPAPWHTQRDDWVSLGAEVGILCGSLAKIAKDLSLMAQGEIAELAEPSGGGRGGSSAMPHKRNPVASMLTLAAALRTPQQVAALLAAMPQEHERGLGNWQAELAEWSGLFANAHGAVSALAEAMAGLQVDARRMRHNIDALQGLVFAEGLSMQLAARIGKARAHHAVEALCRQAVEQHAHLHDVAQEAMKTDADLQAAFNAESLAAVFDVEAAAQPAARLARRQLEALRTAAVE